MKPPTGVKAPVTAAEQSGELGCVDGVRVAHPRTESGWHERAQPHPRPAPPAACGGAVSASLVADLTELARARSAVDALQLAAKVRAKASDAEVEAYLPLVDVLLTRTRELERLRQLAACDELTGIANRRTFNDALRRELARASRSQSPVALLLLDLDALKAINDGLGHCEGDRALCIVARCASEAVRHGDLVARIGGDEFAVLLPNTDAAAAGAVAQRIRDRLARLSAAKSGLLVRVSIGVAVTGSGKSRIELLAAADAELYRDKLARK